MLLHVEEAMRIMAKTLKEGEPARTLNALASEFSTDDLQRAEAELARLSFEDFYLAAHLDTYVRGLSVQTKDILHTVNMLINDG